MFEDCYDIYRTQPTKDRSDILKTLDDHPDKSQRHSSKDCLEIIKNIDQRLSWHSQTWLTKDYSDIQKTFTFHQRLSLHFQMCSTEDHLRKGLTKYCLDILKRCLTEECIFTKQTIKESLNILKTLKDNPDNSPNIRPQIVLKLSKHNRPKTFWTF